MDKDVSQWLASVMVEGVGSLHVAQLKCRVEVCRYLVQALKFDVNTVRSPESGMPSPCCDRCFHVSYY